MSWGFSLSTAKIFGPRFSDLKREEMASKAQLSTLNNYSTLTGICDWTVCQSGVIPKNSCRWQIDDTYTCRPLHLHFVFTDDCVWGAVVRYANIHLTGWDAAKCDICCVHCRREDIQMYRLSFDCWDWRRARGAENKPMQHSFGLLNWQNYCMSRCKAVRGLRYTRRWRVAVTCDRFLRYVESTKKSAVENTNCGWFIGWFIALFGIFEGHLRLVRKQHVVQKVMKD